MGLLKTTVQDFLETVGYEMGYSIDNLPEDVGEVIMLMKMKKESNERRRQTS
jgi:hypothetical protein